MAWTATIVQKGIVDKSFLVGISYSNGTFQFVETANLTGGTMQILSDTVSGRLAQLEATQTLLPQVTLGSFTPTVATPPTPTAFQTFITNLRALQNVQQLVTLGVISSSDTTYVTSLTAVQTTFDQSFIGQF